MALIASHIHSNLVDGALRVSQIIERAFQHGLDLIIITDHDTTKAFDQLDIFLFNSGFIVETTKSTYKIVKSKQGKKLIVVKGCEFTTFPSTSKHNPEWGAHLLGIGYKGKIYSFEATLPTIKAIKEKGGIVVAAHPLFTDFGGVGKDFLLRYSKYFDLWELNGMCVGPFRHYNEELLELARFYKKPCFPGGDFHFELLYFEGFLLETDTEIRGNPVEWLKRQINSSAFNPKNLKLEELEYSNISKMVFNLGKNYISFKLLSQFGIRNKKKAGIVWD
jgi:hypothetical protein